MTECDSGNLPKTRPLAMADTAPEEGHILQTKTFETSTLAEQWARAFEVKMDKSVFVSRAETEPTALGTWSHIGATLYPYKFYRGFFGQVQT